MMPDLSDLPKIIDHLTVPGWVETMLPHPLLGQLQATTRRWNLEARPPSRQLGVGVHVIDIKK
jgi:hypothetical protein